MKTATCTWGDGPDVVLDITEDTFILYEAPKHHAPPQGDWVHGYVTKGSMNLTANEALALAAELIVAANEAKELDGTYQYTLDNMCQHIEGKKKKEKNDS